MSLYTDIRDAVFVWTNRSDLTSETDYAIKNALRTAHKAGTFYRDLVTADLTGQATTQLQTLSLTSVAPGYRQICYVEATGKDLRYAPTDVLDLFDSYKIPKADVFYGIGTNLMIRAYAPVADLTICYYKYPTVSPISSIDSWIADLHQDLIILWAAATVLTFLGEQEIKTRVEALAKLARDDLIADSLEIVRR